MDTNEEKLLFKQEVFQIIGCAIEVLNALGHGIVEKPYENALVVEFGRRKIPFRRSLRSMFSTRARKLACLFQTSLSSSPLSLIQR
jgi:GxxExxY protein